MTFKSIAILTSESSWFIPYANRLVDILIEKNYKAKMFFHHNEINDDYEIVFILSYFELVGKSFLDIHMHNIVVHESDLPKGRGWAPLFWQILENKDEIPVVLFEASEKADEGEIYLKDTIMFGGHELNDEIREKEANKTIELCLKFIDKYESLTCDKQIGNPTYYNKRTPKDSELDVDKTIREQFNLLRIVNNDEYPAFFFHKGHKYTVKIFKN